MSNHFFWMMVVERLVALDEVQEIITLPEFDRSVSRNRQDPGAVQISPIVIAKLKMFEKGLPVCIGPTRFTTSIMQVMF
jgi:hypothetical protein